MEWAQSDLRPDFFLPIRPQIRTASTRWSPPLAQRLHQGSSVEKRVMTEDPARHDNPWSFWTYWRTKIKEDPEATDKSVNEQLDNEKPNWSNDP